MTHAGYVTRPSGEGAFLETGKLEFVKDSENKRFLDSLFGKVTLVTATAIAVGAAVLGGKVLAQREESDA